MADISKININGTSYNIKQPTSLPASDVYSWAKASTKPSYTASEVGAVSKSFDYGMSTSGTAPYNYVWLARIGNSSGYSGLSVDFMYSARYNNTTKLSLHIDTGQYPYNSSSIVAYKDNNLGSFFYKRTANDSTVGYDYYDIYVTSGAWNSLNWTIDKKNGNGTLQYINKGTAVNDLPSGSVEIPCFSVSSATQATKLITSSGVELY